MTMYFDAFTKFGPRPRTHGAHPWSFEHLLGELEHCSISGALVSTTAQTLYDAQFENLRLSRKLADHPGLFALWNVHPHWTWEMPEPDALKELMRTHHVRAVTIHPNTNGWKTGSVTSRPLLEMLERTKTLTVLDWTEIEARDVEGMLGAYPNLPVLIRGVNWSQGRSVVPLVRNFKNAHLGFDFFQSNMALEYLVKAGHEDQLLYCSNAPVMSAGAHRFYVDYAEISQKAREKVAGGNLVRLLKGLKPAQEKVNANEDFIMTEAREGKPLTPLVIDMHAHMLDEGLNGAGGGYMMLEGGPTGVRNLARRMGVDQMGIMSWNGPVGVHADDGNRCVKAALDAYPDFYWGLATFNPMHDSAEVMTRKMEEVYADKRFLGLKPYPQYGIPYSDKRYDCWWEFGSARKLYTGLHPHNWFQGGELDSVCSRFPDLTVVAYHGGGSYEIADTCIALAKKYKNFFIEITLTPVCGGIIDYLAAGAGADRVLYGSDLPMRDPRQQLGWVVYSRLGLEEKKQVLGLNAQGILDRVRGAQK
jgi:predicted TIM-barrel fold metal-dependent hydrolase